MRCDIIKKGAAAAGEAMVLIQSDGGTVLLDGIGEINPCIQLKLLRVLQEPEIEKVGDSTRRMIDVRRHLIRKDYCSVREYQL